MDNLIIGIVLFIVAFIFGFAWPKKSWRWGLWIVGPIFLLIGLSVAFAGANEAFLIKDLPIMLVGLLLACSGSFIGAWLRNRKQRA